MSKAIKILYLEDDEIDSFYMKWLCKKIENVELQLVHDFQNFEALLNTLNADIIITDQYIDKVHYSERLELYLNKKYYVLSNSRELLQEVDHMPVEVLTKPLKLEKLQEIICH